MGLSRRIVLGSFQIEMARTLSWGNTVSDSVEASREKVGAREGTKISNLCPFFVVKVNEVWLWEKSLSVEGVFLVENQYFWQCGRVPCLGTADIKHKYVWVLFVFVEQILGTKLPSFVLSHKGLKTVEKGLKCFYFLRTLIRHLSATPNKLYCFSSIANPP